MLTSIRKQTESSDLSLSDALQPTHFDHIIEAALHCACISQDEEFLKAPSNTIKLKYDVLRLIQIKFTTQLKEGTDAKDTKHLQVINMNWANQVTAHARTELQSRLLNKDLKYPVPEDGAKLTIHLTDRDTALTVENFHHLMDLLLTRRLLFNKHRSGEIETMK